MKNYSKGCKYTFQLLPGEDQNYFCRKKGDCKYKFVVSGVMEGESLTVSFCKKRVNNKTLEKRVNQK